MRDGPPALRANPRVLGQRLLALQDLRKLEEARQLLASLQLTGASAVLQIEVARLRALLDAGDPDAPAAIIQLAALHEGNVDVAALHVRALLRGEDFRAARHALDGLVGDSVDWTVNELEAELLAARARSLMSDDSLLDDALPLLEQALERAPQRGDVRALYVDALNRWQRYEQAEEQLALGLEDPGPDRDALLMAQGDLYRATDRLEEAVACYQAVLDESPQDRAAQVGLARCLGRMGEKEEAVALLESCLERSPDDLDALLVLAEFREAQDEPAEAEALLRRVLEARPNHLKACWRLSRVLARQGRMDEVDELVARYESRKERVRERAGVGGAAER
jgi:tetratricopeptide (TPR) repeat protein